MFTANINRKPMSESEAKIYKTVGKMLRMIMHEKNLRQLDIAAEADISPSTLSNYLDGTRRLNIYKLMKIFKVIDLSDEEIITFFKETMQCIEFDD